MFWNDMVYIQCLGIFTLCLGVHILVAMFVFCRFIHFISMGRQSCTFFPVSPEYPVQVCDIQVCLCNLTTVFVFMK